MSSTIFNIVRHILTKNTQILIFSSTVNKDSNIVHIVKYLEKKEIPTVVYTNLYKDKINKLKEFYENLEQKQEVRREI
jgi:hypothetical protein